MANMAQINAEVLDWLTGEFIEGDVGGILTVSTTVVDVSKFAVVAEARVERLRQRSAQVKAPGSLAIILDPLRSMRGDGDGEFTIDGVTWLIGDGDDNLAVKEVDYDTCLVWVRTFF